MEGARAQVRDEEAYLVRLVTHRALNALRARHRRRESYVGPWLPEPVDTAPRPDEAATVADEVTFALLEQLSPLERAAFVLREVFDVPTSEVAASLNRTPEAVRQLVTRARGHLRGAPRYESGADVQRRIGRAFVEALRTGDVSGVLDMLAPEVVLVTDGGGQVQAALRPIVGVPHVVGFFQGLAERYTGWTTGEILVNGLPALIVHAGGTSSVIQFGVVGGVVTDIWVVRNPEKLRYAGLEPA